MTRHVADASVVSVGSSQWFVWLGIATAVFLVSNQALLRGRAVGIWDAESVFYPYQVLVADHARSGRVVSWDPWSSGGLPAAGEPQLGAYSPLTVAVGLVMGGTAAGYITYWLAVWWLGGLGIFMLARTLRAPPWGACVVALGYLFCGVYTGQAQHMPLTAAFSFLPLVIWRVEAAFASASLRPAVEAGALWGMSALAAYPGLIVITAGFVVLWALGRWLCDTRGRGAAGRPEERTAAEPLSYRFLVGVLFAFFAVGVVVLVPTYVAFFFDGAGSHTRVGVLSREIAVGEGALHPGALSTFASPYLAMLQLPHLEKLWAYTDPSMVSIYAGAAMPILAMSALLFQPRERWRWWVLFLSLLSLGCAVSHVLPLRGWLYDWVYPTRFFRHAAVFRDYYIFSIAALALLGTRDLGASLARSGDRIWYRFAAAAAIVGALAIATFSSFTASWPNPNGHPIAAYVHLGIVWVGTMTLAIGAIVDRSNVFLRLAGVLLPLLAVSDALMTAGLSQNMIMNVGGHPMAASPDRWRALDRHHEARLDLTSAGLFRMDSACLDPSCEFLANDQMITKQAVFSAYSAQLNQFHREIVEDPRLRRMAVGSDRIWFSRNGELVAPTKKNLAALRDRTKAVAAAPLLVHSPEAMLRIRWDAGVEGKHDEASRIAHLPPAERLPAEVVRYDPTELVLRVQSPADGWLLVTDRWARQWHAEINGKPTTVFGGNFIFRAIEVPAGVSEIRFSYRASGFPWLLIASWGTLAAVGGRATHIAIRRHGVTTHGGEYAET